MKDKKLDLRIIKTKKNIYEALLMLMETKPFEEIKVSDICEKAMINRSTFYAHFEDKYFLFNSLITDLKDRLKKELNKNKNISNSKEYYMELIKLLLDHFESEKDIYTKIMLNNRNSIAMDMLYEALNEDITKRIEVIGNDLYKEIPSEFVSRFFLGALLNVGLESIKRKNSYSKEQILNYLNILIFELDK